MSTTLTTETRDLEQRSLTLTDQARALKIVDQPSYDAAARLLQGAAALAREIEDHHREMKAKAHGAWKAIVDAEKRLLAIPEEAKRLCKAAIVAFDQEQERQRRAEEARREAEERQRAEEAQLAAAIAAEAQGASVEHVQAILEEELLVPAVTVVPTYQKAAAISKPRTYWSGRCDSLSLLIKAAAADSRWESLLIPNTAAINQLANSLRSNFSVPGCSVHSRADINIRVKP